MPVLYAPGTVLNSPLGKEYTILKAGPRGGQATCFYVQDQNGVELFMKMFTEVTALSPEAAEFVERQAHLLRILHETSDFVCVDLDFFMKDGCFCKVSELMTGDTLEDRLDRAADGHTWGQEDRLLNASVLAFTVAEIHDQGLAHLDLKPENCFLAERVIRSTGERKPVVKLLDFDGALIEGAPLPPTYLGTVNYWSPEHTPGRAGYPPGKAADVFTLGVMLYEVLANRYPFRDPSGYLHREAPHPREVAPWLPEGVSEVMWHCLAPVPDDRPTSREVHQVLLGTAEVPARLRTAAVAHPPLAAPTRLALVADERRIRFWKDDTLTRAGVRGLPGYEYVDREQARIRRSAEGFWAAHVPEATNATLLNGAALASEAWSPLGQGDILEVGPFRVQVEMEWDRA